MNIVLWALQASLVLILLPAAVTRALSYEFAKKRMAWVAAVPRSLLLFISVAEILGAIGLVLPGLPTSRLSSSRSPRSASGSSRCWRLCSIHHEASPETRAQISFCSELSSSSLQGDLSCRRE